MKQVYLKSLLSLLVFFVFNLKQVEATVNVMNVTVTSSPVTACTNTDLSITGQIGSSSYMFNGVNVTHSGFNITVDVHYLSGGIGIPVIGNFTQVGFLGVLSPGTYTVTTNGILSGVVNSTIVTTIIVPNLPTVNLGADTTICAGDSLLLNATSASAVSYLWQDLSSDSMFSVKNGGLYWVQLTDGNGCTSVDSVLISTMVCVTGIEERDLGNTLNIFPNPAKNNVNIQLPTNLNGLDVKVQIFNIDGSLISDSKLNTLNKVFRLEIGELSNGLYFIQVSNGLDKWNSKLSVYR